MSADFLDSNIFVYQLDRADPRKSDVASAILEQGLDGSAVTSFQVVQETMSVITRKLPVSQPEAEARRYLDEVLSTYWTVMPSARLYRAAIDIRSRYGFHFYDSLIVAAALEAGCDRLLSEDFQDGQRIEGLTVVNPFRDVS